jgi:hypothetical protein
MNLRDLPVYKMHLDCNEPEGHTKVTIEACISILDEFINDCQALYDKQNKPTIGIDAGQLIVKRNELRAYLK